MRQCLWTLLLAAAMTCDIVARFGTEGRAQQYRVRAQFAPVVGTERRCTVRSGDTLLGIARRNNSDASSIARLNGLHGDHVRPGQHLLLPSRHILPAVRRSGIVLNIPERGVYLFRRGRILARFPVAVGMRTWETPIGTFKVVRKVKNPAWIPPKVMVKREHIPESLVKPGPTNPLGDRWIGWSAPEVGFHATSLVDTVGRLASHACVRMYPESAHKLFDIVRIGTPIYAEYEPVKLGRQDGQIYLSVSPDVYGSGKASFDSVMERLRDAGIADSVDEARIRRIVARQDGYPWAIAPYEGVAASQAPDRNARDRVAQSLPNRSNN